MSRGQQLLFAGVVVAAAATTTIATTAHPTTHESCHIYYCPALSIRSTLSKLNAPAKADRGDTHGNKPPQTVAIILL